MALITAVAALGRVLDRGANQSGPPPRAAAPSTPARLSRHHPSRPSSGRGGGRRGGQRGGQAAWRPLAQSIHAPHSPASNAPAPSLLSSRRRHCSSCPQPEDSVIAD